MRSGWLKRKKAEIQTPTETPSDLWSTCAKCHEVVFERDFQRNLKVCPRCGHHHRLTAEERLEITVDENSFTEINGNLAATDPLEFPDYAAKLEASYRATGKYDGMITGSAQIEGIPVAVGVADFSFMGGSMGSVSGEKIVRLMEFAEQQSLPVILFTASGGARMHEGLFSLMQMAKTSAAVARLDRSRIPYLVVLTDPTTAGVLASYASLGDVILAEAGAVVGFAGRRVGNQELGARLPANFQTSEFQLEHGMIDRIVQRKELRPTLAYLLRFFGAEVEEMEDADQSI